MKRQADFSDDEEILISDTTIVEDSASMKRQRSTPPPQAVGPLAIHISTGTLSLEQLQPRASSMPGVHRLLSQSAANCPIQSIRLYISPLQRIIDTHLSHVLSSIQRKCYLIFEFPPHQSVPSSLIDIPSVSENGIFVSSTQAPPSTFPQAVSLHDPEGHLARECKVIPSLGPSMVLVLDGEVKASMLLSRSPAAILEAVHQWSSL